MGMRVAFGQLQPPTRAAVKMVQGPWFLSKFAGSWVFQAQSADITLARFRYTLVAAPRPLHRLIEPLAALYFSRVVAKRLAGLKAFCEGPGGTAGARTGRRVPGMDDAPSRDLTPPTAGLPTAAGVSKD